MLASASKMRSRWSCKFARRDLCWGAEHDHRFDSRRQVASMERTRLGVRAIIYFEVVSTIALIVGLVVGNLWQPGAGLHIAPASLDEKAVAGYISSAKSLTIVDFLMKMVPSNFVGAIAQGDLLPVLVIAILFGFALCQMGERGQRLVPLIDESLHELF